jgi:hypothetical protein
MGKARPVSRGMTYVVGGVYLDPLSQQKLQGANPAISTAFRFLPGIAI